MAKKIRSYKQTACCINLKFRPLTKVNLLTMTRLHSTTTSTSWRRDRSGQATRVWSRGKLKIKRLIFKTLVRNVVPNHQMKRTRATVTFLSRNHSTLLQSGNLNFQTPKGWAPDQAVIGQDIQSREAAKSKKTFKASRFKATKKYKNCRQPLN